jgi:hypothetical protein
VHLSHKMNLHRRQARHPNLRRGREWFFVFNLHGMLSVAMILILLGITHMMDNTETDTTKFLMKMGMSMMVLTYFIVMTWLIFSLMGSQSEPTAPAYADGSMVSKLQPRDTNSDNRISSWCTALSLLYHSLAFD